jgi:hypothetical protein
MGEKPPNFTLQDKLGVKLKDLLKTGLHLTKHKGECIQNCDITKQMGNRKVTKTALNGINPAHV